MKNIIQNLECWSWVRILIAVLLIIGAYAIGVIVGMDGSHDKRSYSDRGMKSMDKMMQEKQGYKNTDKSDMGSMNMDHSTMNMSSMDPMDMSMKDMGTMLQGKTGDALNKAFLEGMIPHHQGAIDMAKYLAGSNKPELVKLGADIITAQQKEIDQMTLWMKEWGYISTSSTMSGGMSPQDEMMREHCRVMPNMADCKQYR